MVREAQNFVDGYKAAVADHWRGSDSGGREVNCITMFRLGKPKHFNKNSERFR